jgi:branched-chain amino acid transport system substrate-binding protein
MGPNGASLPFEEKTALGHVNETWRSAARALAVLTVIVVGLSSCGSESLPPQNAGGSATSVGALLSLTGSGKSLGIASKAALEIAATDINAYLAKQGSATRVRVVTQDTKHDPALALQKLQALAGQGVKIAIGPQTSSELQALKPYADQNGIVLISHGSTASSLSIAGDNVFRVVPDDKLEGEAVVALMWGEGIRTVVPLWRTDAGNQGLHDSMKRAMEARGGSVTDGVGYPTTAPDFAAALSTIRAQVSQAASGQAPGSVGVYLAAFDEAVTIFNQAKDDPVLSSVKWYGSDGVVQLPALVKSAPVAGFAAKAGYPCPTYGLDDALEPKWKPVADQIRARTRITPDAFALSAYDALEIAMLAYGQAGGTGNLTTFKQALVQAADGYSGITGPVVLNEAGDRKTGNFDFWAVRKAGGKYEWERVARYRSSPDGTGTITRLTRPGSR